MYLLNMRFVILNHFIGYPNDKGHGVKNPTFDLFYKSFGILMIKANFLKDYFIELPSE